ncbi:chalcone isomerase family protein [Endozoicomonas sp. GU-1]|uniref:chalcone isomerase family protein n=1 Tax=Endozoicomonas sp. GU-1 TaxID=3009078 RepID=UPI0022B3ACA7|nr:chalcone isomerase family protein [Endozoicomonas sp. GU-1]WBA79616.1 chalcone isomerase family protein [Endozoicomonas sp. GU-1]WBA87198.1 chalcone isomerase family protein [Endozoicomonas sp. GU-1]
MQIYDSFYRIPLLTALLMLLSLPVNALVINKYDLPDTIAAEGDKPELKLQGAAVRSWYLMVKGYIGALYLEEPTSSPEEIYASDTHQRMAFVLLLSKMSARRIANAFYESIQLNSPPDEQEAVKEDLEKIFTLVDGSMKKGEQAVFEYLPGKGLRIEIAGDEKGIVPANKELFNLFLRVWIGETPPSKPFKEQVLGVAPAA